MPSAPDRKVNGDIIRRLARKQQMSTMKSRKDGLWYIADEKGILIFSAGLDDDEALRFLTTGRYLPKKSNTSRRQRWGHR